MAASTTPPSASQSTSLIIRDRHASPWRVTRFSHHLPSNPLTLQPSNAAGLIPNPLYQQLPERVVRLTLSFSLLTNGIPRNPTEAEVRELQSHFKTLRSVGFQHPFLVLVVDILPPQPWPVIIADVPLWITSSANEPPFDMGQLARASQKFTVLGEIRQYHTPNDTTVIEVFKLLNTKGAGIHRIQWDGAGFHAFGSQDPGEGWQDRLPSRVNNICISYTWTASNLEEHAARMKIPTAEATDDSRYAPTSLRPGIMLGGLHNNMIQRLGTTSGIRVESPTSGAKFITVASHGFPGNIGDYVFHPSARLINGSPDLSYQIGTIEKKFGDTDIALARLRPGIGYHRETFTDNGVGQPRAQPFRFLKDPSSLRWGDTVFMNTPVNGLCEGIHLVTSWSIGFGATDVTPQESPTHVETSTFSYWGNGADIFVDGCCGGVIWDQNFDVIGQFRFQEKGGQKRAFSPTFKVLIDQGYQLSDI